MGERKGTNKYYPPDFNPRIHKNLNAYHGTHALRERGRKADQGVLTIRFEMPYNCWCLTCKNPIGMGVRYNSEKTKVGMYHSTPIYKFTMPCHLCAGTIVMQTDPQNFDYVILEGARRKHQKWDPEENEQVVIADAMEKKKLALDAMYHLEHDVKDKSKRTSIAPIIQQLELDRESFKDDFSLNQLARKQFREAKRIAIAKAISDNTLMNRLSLTGSGVHLLPEEETDRSAAKLMRLNHTKKQASSHSNNVSKPNSGRSSSVDCQAVFASKMVPASTLSPLGSPSSSTTSSSGSSVSGTLKRLSGGPSAVDYMREQRRAHLLGQRARAFQVKQTTSQQSPTGSLNTTASSDTAHLLSNNSSWVRVRTTTGLKRTASEASLDADPPGEQGAPTTEALPSIQAGEDTSLLLVGYTDSDED